MREDFNLNIRRYVDNSPPPEPHDVRAHLHGGIPAVEVNALRGYFDNYAGVRDLLFQPRDDRYLDFTPAISGKGSIKPLIESAPGTLARHAAFHEALGQWWDLSVSALGDLPRSRNVYDLRRRFLGTIAEALVPQGVLDGHKVRGAFAGFMNTLAGDLKSVAASGWNAELIPEEDILRSQFPDVLERIEADRTRIAELEALFAAASEAEEDDAAPDEADTEGGVLPKSLVQSLKEERKALNAEVKDAKKRVKERRADALRAERSRSPLFDPQELRTEASDDEADAQDRLRRLEEIDEQLSRHTALEVELRTLRANMRAAEKAKDDLVAAARARITEAEAKVLILARFRRVLTEQFDEYLRQYQRGLVAAVENLWAKYAVTARQILAERDREAAQLDGFLKELGYE